MLARREFGAMGLSAAGAMLTGGVLSAADEKAKDSGAHRHEHHHNDVMEACAEACSDCQRECDSCAAHCGKLLGEGHKDHALTLATCLDCADICAAAAHVVSRTGPFAQLICESCAEACSRCGKECEKFADDQHMQACADACRKCEKACRSMLPHLGHTAS